MDIAALNDNFGIPGSLWLEDHAGLTRVQVRTHSAAATVYLHGAHVTHWQPTGGQPVLFLSPNSEFAADKPIRGGIPICFPWFGPRKGGLPGPSHGFARTQPWDLAFAAYLAGPEGKPEADAMTLSFVLSPTELSRSLGFDDFRVEYRMTIGASLTLSLTVGNLGTEPLAIEEALHTYFAIEDVRQVTITGLESAAFLDKTDGLREKHTPDGPLRLTAETDSVFPGNTDVAAIHDRARTITNTKRDSATTVVWNPWGENSAKVADLGPDVWIGYVCLETANTGSDTLTVSPGKTHTMSTTISVSS